MELLGQYTKETDQRRQRDEADPPPAWTQDQQQQHRTVQKRAAEGGISRAKSALEAGPPVANDAHTLQGLRKPVAIEVDEQERCRLQVAVRTGKRITSENAPDQKKTFRRRVTLLQSESPGPNGWRETYIQMMAHVEGGMVALQECSTLCAQGEVTQEMASVWTVAVCPPTGWGEDNSADLDVRKRKIRSIACSEALVKLTETSAIDAAYQ